MSLKTLVSDPAWLFDFGFPVRRWGKKIDREVPHAWELGDAYRIPALNSLSDTAGGATSWMAWSDEEILVRVQLPHAVPMSTPDIIFSLDFYIDSRSSRGIHRANAYCHLFQFRFRQSFFSPVQNKFVDARPGLISRAKAIPAYNQSNRVCGWLTSTPSMLDFKLLIPYQSVAGCDPREFPEWGVMWVVSDGRKRCSLARHSLQIPLDDPSLWCRARLVETSDA